MKRLLILAALSAAALYTSAQNTLKGKVTDASGKTPLSGATVTLSGKTTTTDKEGMFIIECGGNGKLDISYIGYAFYQQGIKNCGDFVAVSLSSLTNTLEEVEITATSAQNKSLLNQPASITKLSKPELNRATGLFLDDAINTNVPGVTMNRRAVSSGQQFNIRGYGNGARGTNGVSSNFDGQGYKVYLNGIPVTDAEGITLMDDIDFGSIGNVEVTKGPSGTLYGMAVAGAVNLRTVRPEAGKTSIGQQVLLGNYGLRRYTTSLQSGMERSSFLLNYGRQESDGFTVHNASHKDFLNLVAAFQPSAKQSINTYLGYSNSYDQRFGELTITQYNNRDYSGNPSYIKNDAHSVIISFRAGVGHTYNFNRHIANTTTLFGTGISNNASSAGGWTDKSPINYGLRSTFDTRFSLGEDIGLNAITGIETQRQRAQVIGYFMVPDSANLAGYNRLGAERSNQYTITGTTSLFTQWTLSLPHDLSLTAGLGVSNQHIELDDRFFVLANNRPNNLVPTHFEKDYKELVSPHIALNKIFSKSFSVYAAYSKGYKAPVSSYFYIPYVAGNATTGRLNQNLVPEEGTQFELGSKGNLLHNRLSYEVAAFKAIFNHKMTAVAVPLNGSATAYTYVVNGGKQEDNGLEISIKGIAYQSGKGFIKSISPFANFTYSDFNYRNFQFHRFGINPNGSENKSKDSTVDYSGKAVAGVAPVMFNVGLDVITTPGVYLNVYYNYKDAVPITSDGLYNAKSYSLLNGKVGFRRSLSSHFDLDASFGATNLTGEQYYYMVFINQLPDAYLPAPLKANVFGGINLKYNF